MPQGGYCPYRRDDRGLSSLRSSQETGETTPYNGDTLTPSSGRPSIRSRTTSQVTLVEKVTLICRSEGIAEKSVWKLLEAIGVVEQENSHEPLYPAPPLAPPKENEKKVGDIDDESKRVDFERFDCELPQFCQEKSPKIWKIRAILAIVAGALQQSLCWGMIMTFGTILAYYTTHLMPKTSKVLITLIGAIAPFSVLSMSGLHGRLLDAGHHRKINVVGSILITAGLTGMAFTGGDGTYGQGIWWAILLAAVPVGIGESCFFVSCAHVATTWFPERKGLAVGFTSTGAAIGGSIYPLVFKSLVAKWRFSAGMGGLAVISGVLAPFIIIFAVPNPGWTPRKIPINGTLETWLPYRAFKSRVLLLHTVAMCFIYSGILSVPFFLEYWARERGIGISEEQGNQRINHGTNGAKDVYVLSWFNSSQVVGRLFGSTLTDVFRARKLHVVACILSIATISGFWTTSNNLGNAMIFAGLFGWFTGLMASLPVNDVAEILGRNRMSLLGQFVGIVYLCASPFVLVGPVITAALVESFGISAVGIWACVVFGIGGCLLVCSLCVRDDVEKLELAS